MKLNIEMVTGGPVMTNTYVVADPEGVAFVLDPGFEPDLVAPVVARRGWRVEAIVATHGHFDHVGGMRRAKELWPVPVWMHTEAAPVATHCGDHALWFGVQCENCPPPDHLLEHGDTFTCGQLSFEIRHTPGHSPGGISLICDGHAFVGDCLFAGSIGRADLPHSDPRLLMRSIRESLMTLPDETIVYPGHGETTTIGSERRQNPFRKQWSVPL